MTIHDDDYISDKDYDDLPDEPMDPRDNADWTYGSEGFAKLYGDKISNSSLLQEPVPTRWLFLFMLSQADSKGRYKAAGVWNVAHDACMSMDEAEAGIRALESPDPDSTSPAHEGRRIKRIRGGWQILNHDAHRNYQTKKQRADAARKRKEREPSCEHCGGPLPTKSRVGTRYCSKSCSNKARNRIGACGARGARNEIVELERSACGARSGARGASNGARNTHNMLDLQEEAEVSSGTPPDTRYQIPDTRGNKQHSSSKKNGNGRTEEEEESLTNLVQSIRSVYKNLCPNFIPPEGVVKSELRRVPDSLQKHMASVVEHALKNDEKGNIPKLFRDFVNDAEKYAEAWMESERSKFNRVKDAVRHLGKNYKGIPLEEVLEALAQDDKEVPFIEILTQDEVQEAYNAGQEAKS